MTRRHFVRLLGAGAAASSTALLLAACQPASPSASPTQAAAPPAGAGVSAPTPAPQQPVKGGSLIVALSAEVVDMDPANRGGTPTAAAEQLVFNGLVRNTPDPPSKPDLAASWTVDDDKWTFKLRQGVKFHDGTPCSAQAVKYTFDRYLNNTEKVRRAGDWQPYLDAVQVIDDSTIQFRTKGVDAFFLSRLARRSGLSARPHMLSLARIF